MGCPYPALKWPFLKRIMRAAQADVHMVEVPLWPVRGGLMHEGAAQIIRMLASCMRRSFDIVVGSVGHTNCASMSTREVGALCA
jgi:hypothetical protein